MKLIVNVSRVVSGGGQQVAISTLDFLIKDLDFSIIIFAQEKSKIEKNFINCKNVKVYSIDKDLFLSKLQMIRLIKFKYSKAVILNFGPVVPFINNYQIVRSVYSNLFYPEIDFWSDIKSNIRKLQKKIKDYFRLQGTLRADLIWFENKDMMNRCITIFQKSKKNVFYCAPSYSTDFNYENISDHNKLRIFYPATPYPNKGIDILKEVALECQKQQINYVKFILTFNKKDKPGFTNFIVEHNLNSYFEFTGILDNKRLNTEYSKCNGVLLLSKLECFSSSVIESAFFKKPIIGSDLSWLRMQLDNEGVFVDRENPISILAGIKKLKSKPIIDFDKILSNYNSPKNKYKCLKEKLLKAYSL